GRGGGALHRHQHLEDGERAGGLSLRRIPGPLLPRLEVRPERPRHLPPEQGARRGPLGGPGAAGLRARRREPAHHRQIGTGDGAFDMPFPPRGEKKRMPSVVSAFAQIVRWRVEQLQAGLGEEPFKLAQEPGSSPIMDAMFALKEPKTGTDGTISWTVDVLNPRTGDDFVLGLKDITLPDGVTRPYSVWLSREYPRPLAGL